VKYRCLVCGEDAAQKYIMNRHIRHIHPGENRVPEARAPPTALFKLGPFMQSYVQPGMKASSE
jgi:hypothetical protein